MELRNIAPLDCRMPIWRIWSIWRSWPLACALKGDAASLRILSNRWKASWKVFVRPKTWHPGNPCYFLRILYAISILPMMESLFWWSPPIDVKRMKRWSCGSLRFVNRTSGLLDITTRRRWWIVTRKGGEEGTGWERERMGKGCPKTCVGHFLYSLSYRPFNFSDSVWIHWKLPQTHLIVS